ncbi:MAG: hypothetical protein LBP59_17865 [Planctomycetaceae bacterium]|nr:hypothetical protein [Planctomycetaceae bacterium]
MRTTATGETPAILLTIFCNKKLFSSFLKNYTQSPKTCRLNFRERL